MQKRAFGNTGCWVSPIGLGTVKLGRNQQVKYPHSFEIPDDAAVKKLLHTALELGINVIDTAPAYGSSEERLGQLLPGNRADWHIVTKVGEEFIDGQSLFNFSPSHIQKSIERSLQRLRTDYLDTVLVHSNGDDVEIINHWGVLDILAEMKARGLLRFYGMSTKTVAGGLLALKKSDVVMATYNLQDQHDIPVFKKAEELGKAMLVKKAFSSGHLHARHASDAVIETFKNVLSMSAVSSIVIGTCNPVHLRENVALMEEL